MKTAALGHSFQGQMETCQTHLKILFQVRIYFSGKAVKTCLSCKTSWDGESIYHSAHRGN
jgi:hypothetical protein